MTGCCGFKIHPRYWGRIAEAVGLALIVGGMVALGPMVAPLLFHNLPREEAAKVMTMIFRRFDTVLTIAMVLVVLGEMIQLKFGSWAHGLTARLRSIFALLLISMMVCSVAVLHPKMEAFQKQGVMRWAGEQGQELDKVHRAAEGMMKVEMVLGLLTLILLGLPIPHSKPAEEKA